MTNLVQDGDVLNHTVTSGEASIASGAVVIEGEFVGIAVTAGTYANNDVISVNLKGVYVLPKNTSLAIAKGDKLYWDTTPGEITKTASDRFIGVAWTSQGSSDTTVQVKLGTVTAAFAGALKAALVAYTAGTNLVGVDGTGSNAAPLAGTETRLDAIDTFIAALKASLIAAGLMSAT